MLSLRKAVLVLGIAALCVAPSMAQGQRGQRGGFGGMGGGQFLLMNTGVQKELKLSEEQVTKIRESGQEVFQKYQDDFQKIRELPQEEQGEKRAELMKKIAEDNKKALAEIMKPEQVKRFREIEIQQGGVTMALTDTDLAGKLKLTDAQKTGLKEIQDDLQRETRALFQGAGGGGFDAQAFQENQKKMQAMRKESQTKAASLLSDDQKKTWKEITGEPFEVKFEGFGQGGPGGGRGKKKKDK